MPLLVISTHASGCWYIIGVGGLFIVDLGVWRCLLDDKLTMSHATCFINEYINRRIRGHRRHKIFFTIMKKGFIYLLSSIAIMGLWSCKDEKDEPEQVVTPEPVPETTLTVSLSEIVLEEEKGSEQVLTITSSEQWALTENPEWLHVSATSGNGMSTVTVRTNSFNNSSSERIATLKITASDKECDVVVKQKPGLVADCAVTPDVYVILADGYACDWKYGSNVSYFYRYLLPKADERRYTDAEILEKMQEDGERATPADNFVTSWRYLDTQTQYVLYSVAYDRNGKQGEIIKTEFTTKSDINQAEASIEVRGYTDSYWFWNTTIGGYCSKYYMFSLMGSDFESAGFYDSDASLAWLIKSANEEASPLTPIVQNESWQRERTYADTNIQIVTWGCDASGNYAGVINRSRTYIDDNTRTVKYIKSALKTVAHKVIESEARDCSEDLKNIKVISCY